MCEDMHSLSISISIVWSFEVAISLEILRRFAMVMCYVLVRSLAIPMRHRKWWIVMMVGSVALVMALTMVGRLAFMDSCALCFPRGGSFAIVSILH